METLLRIMVMKSDITAFGPKTSFCTTETVTPTGDQLFSSRWRNELATRGHRLPSALLVSSLGRTIIHQNPGILDAIFKGHLPQSHLGSGSDSEVTVSTVEVSGTSSPLVIKYHGEGNDCYGSSYTDSDIDKVGGIDNFLALRAIDLFAAGVDVPEPIFATHRIFVSSLVEGEHMLRREIPEWLRDEVKQALEKAYCLGWLNPPKRWGKEARYHIDLSSSGNLIRTAEGKKVVIDPIR